MDDVTIARALHVLGVVMWIGGVGFVTTVVIPAIRNGAGGLDAKTGFGAIEGRFAWQARISVAVVGLTGIYMIAAWDLWDRFLYAEFWWMHAMVAIWLIFAAMIFVLEPLFLHRRHEMHAKQDPSGSLKRMAIMHWILLILSLITVAGAVAGSHGGL